MVSIAAIAVTRILRSYLLFGSALDEKGKIAIPSLGGMNIDEGLASGSGQELVQIREKIFGVLQ